MNYPLMYPDYPFAIVTYIVLENKGRETYGKEALLSEIPATGGGNLALPPTSQYWGPYAGIEDYGLEC
jgi:hypothetical protein